ncbi:MAG: shikimate kinase, partial [Cellvibrionales bacterium]|nr:shikimate kinase [Cellvibrionales bacterium]
MDNTKKHSLILVGMPGAGKSTVGIVLAKALAKDFIDTDLLIQLRAGKPLQAIIDSEGYQRLRDLEEEALLAHEFFNHIVATGGSAVYSEKGMNHLKQYGQVIYLDANLDTLRSRIHNYESRGIAKRNDQTFDDLFKERQALYRKYADLIIDCNHDQLEKVVCDIQAQIEETS